MIAEDDESLALLLQYNFSSCGYDVEAISNGAAADERLKCAPPDLLILDWGLPTLAGIEVLRRLRTRGGSRYVPVIMLTARCDREQRLRAVSSGVDVFLTKPFSLADLMSHARSLVRSGNSISA